MKELYFISVLGNLSFCSTVIAIISGCIVAILAVAVGIPVEDDNCDKDAVKASNKILMWSSIIFVVTLVLSLFIPSKRELYIIYGVGTAIDYIQESDEAKQLPDKTIKMLNAMADEYIDKSTNNKQEKSE